MDTFHVDYGTTDSTKNTFSFVLFDETSAQAEATPVTFATGDAKISQNNGALVNTTNLPSHVGQGLYKITLTQAELQAKSIVILIQDQTSPKTWLDAGFRVLTGGNTNAWFTA